eukprot:Pgem_evm1s6869
MAEIAFIISSKLHSPELTNSPPYQKANAQIANMENSAKPNITAATWAFIKFAFL